VLVTPVAAKGSCFQELFKTVQAARISSLSGSNFQTVVVAYWNARQLYVLSRQRGTVRQFRLADRRWWRQGAASEAGMRWSTR